MYGRAADILRELIEREHAEESLYEFAKQAWSKLKGEPYNDNWHIQYICEHLEALVRRQIRNLMILLPPRCMKSTLIGVMFPAWVWIHNPNEQFLYTSYAASLSRRDSVGCRRLITTDWYQNRWGERYRLTKDQNTKIRFENDRGGYRIAASVGSAITGEGGTILVADDPNNAKEAESDVKREGTNDWWSQVMSTRLNDPKTGCKLLTQQRLHEKDLAGYIMENDVDGEWIRLILPMEFEPGRRAKTIILPSTPGKIWEDPRQKEGELLWPSHIGPKELKTLKRELKTEYRIASQLQMRPAPADGGLIKGHWFRKWEKPAPPKLLRVIQSVDTAFEEKDTNNYSAILTLGLFMDDMGFHSLILLNLWRGKLNYPNLRDLCKNLYDDYRNDGSIPITPDGHHQVDMMLIEAKANGISLVQDLRRANINAHRFVPDKYGDKMQRVVLASSLIAEGLVFVPMMPPDFKRYRPMTETLLHLCKIFPNSESRDVVDCLSQAILYLMNNGILTHRFDKNTWASLARPTASGLYNDVNPL